MTNRVLVLQTEFRGYKGGKMEKTAMQPVIMAKWLHLMFADN